LATFNLRRGRALAPDGESQYVITFFRAGELRYLHSNCCRENHARMRQLTRRELAVASRRWWWVVTGSSAWLFCNDRDAKAAVAV